MAVMIKIKNNSKVDMKGTNVSNYWLHIILLLSLI